MQTDNIISFKHVGFTYPESKNAVLKDVSFNVKQGSWTSLIGHNGSGKSTISKLINGLLLPNFNGKTEIRVAGIPLNNRTIWQIREKVGIVFQNPDNQFVGATVGDDVAFGLENRGVPREQMLKIVKKVLTEVDMLDYINSEPSNLSGGQKQRVAIAGILAVKPAVIILDESTSMLDPNGRKQILELIRKILQTKKQTVISITHDIDEASESDEVIVLNDGKIIADDTPTKIFQRPQMLQKIGLDIPFTQKLIIKLKENGITIPNKIETKDELIKYLCQLNSKM